MRRPIAAISLALPLALAALPAHAVTIVDATGDILPSFVGTATPDLDVTTFSVNYSAGLFTIGATFAGAINPGTGGIYVYGVNTGNAALRPFGAIGQGNVVFTQAITIRKDGTGSLGQTALNPADILIAGNSITFKIAASLLPGTGLAPEQYGWNLWPRIGTGNNNQITDFAPENSTLAAVPEPSTWALLMAGFGTVGMAMRLRRRKRIALA